MGMGLVNYKNLGSNVASEAKLLITTQAPLRKRRPQSEIPFPEQIRSTVQ